VHARLASGAGEAAFAAMVRIRQQIRAVVAAHRRSAIADALPFLTGGVRLAFPTAVAAVVTITLDIDTFPSAFLQVASACDAAWWLSCWWMLPWWRLPSCWNAGAIPAGSARAGRAIVECSADSLPAYPVLPAFAAFLLDALLANAAPEAATGALPRAGSSHERPRPIPRGKERSVRLEPPAAIALASASNLMLSTDLRKALRVSAREGGTRNGA
jgi:hypothetical protein